jgi:hypothetical protein
MDVLTMVLALGARARAGEKVLASWLLLPKKG